MKIAIISRTDNEVGPTITSGVSVITYFLTNELAKRKNISQIDIYGIGRNYFTNKKINFIQLKSTASKAKIYKELPRYAPIQLYEHMVLNYNIRIIQLLQKKQYDVIHDNTVSSVFPAAANLLSAPVLTTMHTPVRSEVILIPHYFGVFQKNKRNQFVTISNYQRGNVKKFDLNINLGKTIYNGIDTNIFEFSDKTKSTSYALWLGRISCTDNKGIKEALELNKKVIKKLKVVGAVYDKDFFKEIFYLFKENTYHNGLDLTLEQKNRYYMRASFFIYPLQWEEPFGLVLLEAMASGTPVIAYARGSIPEIIKDGKTGFIVNSSDDDNRGDWIVKKTGMDGLKEAVERIYSMSPDEYREMRLACRRHVEEHFSIKKMADEYESAYLRLMLESELNTLASK